MIDKLAYSLAVGIKNVVPEHPASIARLKYALSFILNAGFIIFLSLLLSIFTGKTGQVATLLFAFALLRQVSGGIHLKSGTMCVLATVSTATVLSFVTYPDMYTLIITSISIVIVLLYAPSGIENQTRIPPKYYPLLKLVSVLLVSSNFVIESKMTSIAFLVQSLSLIIPRKEVNSK
ncbi:accessory gene regulator B family protein [Paenibacillus thailandensis]|uniref:Accessory gene regulator B family protein n=1 Tax=Paenibacillus thailandensis TaxID=393250 RepID=A0ABW5R3I9_9BACL